MAIKQSWFSYWQENMEALGIPIPPTLMGSQQMAMAYIGALVAAVEKFGPKVTVRDLVVAGKLSEQLMYIGALSAAYVAGAAIGSAAVATGRCLSGGTSLGDVMTYAMQNNFNATAAINVIRVNPQIYDTKSPARKAFALKAVIAGHNS